jgi:hypothetical protein
MFKLQYIANISFGALIKQGVNFYKHILWKVFPLAYIAALTGFVYACARIALQAYVGWQLIVNLLFILLTFIFMWGLVYQAYSPTKFERLCSIREALLATWSKIIKIIIAILLSILALAVIITVLGLFLMLVLAMIPSQSFIMGWFFIFIAAIISIIGLVIISLIVPVALFEDVGIIGVIKRSVILVHKDFWKSLVAVLIAKAPVFIFVLLVNAIIVLLFTGSLTELHTYFTLQGSFIPIIIIQVILLLTLPFFSIWSVANILNLYHTLKGSDEPV